MMFGFSKKMKRYGEIILGKDIADNMTAKEIEMLDRGLIALWEAQEKTGIRKGVMLHGYNLERRCDDRK